jgi:hypothetical protein
MLRQIFLSTVLLTAQCAAAGNPFAPIANMVRRSKDASYAKAYVESVPGKLPIDPKALMNGMNGAKNLLGRLSTFDSSEYSQIGNPMQLGFVEPPNVADALRSTFAFVGTLNPGKFSVDMKALMDGLKGAKNCLGTLSTFDANEYSHIGNPMQLGFVQVPTVTAEAEKASR